MSDKTESVPIRIAVTGATGFVGEALVRDLVVEGFVVSVLTRQTESSFSTPHAKSIRVVQGDLLSEHCDLADFLNECEAVIHCAGEVDDESKMWALHVDGTRRLASAAQGAVGHFVQLSSVGVYGPISEGVVSEDREFAPVGVYEKTKAEAEAVLTAYAKSGAFTLSIVRPSNIVGDRMPNQSLRSLIGAISASRFFFVGRPGAIVDYVHVDDVSRSLIRAISYRDGAAAFNIANPMRLDDLVEHIGRATGRTPRRRPRLPLWICLPIARFGSIWSGFPLSVRRVRTLSSRSIYATDRAVSLLGMRLEHLGPAAIDCLVAQVIGKEKQLHEGEQTA